MAMLYWCITCARHTKSLRGDDVPHRCSRCSPEAISIKRVSRRTAFRVTRESTDSQARTGNSQSAPAPTSTSVPIPAGWADVEVLGFIVPLENLDGVLSHGIVSHDKALRLSHTSLADRDVQLRRENKVVPVNGRRIHSCANVYLNPRNAMMYRLVKNRRVDSLAVVNVDAETVLRMPGAAIADRNAAVGDAEFFKSPSGLSELDPSRVFAKQWSKNGQVFDVLKQAMMAEVLVPDQIPSSAISSVTVVSMGQAALLQRKYPDYTFVADKGLFFQ